MAVTKRAVAKRPTLLLPLAVLAAGVVACERDEPAISPPTTEEVAESPNRYIGQKMTLTGEVDSVYGDRAFELEGNDVFFDSSVLVLTRSPVRMGGAQLQDDDRVSVTGTMRNFVVTDLERELSWDLTPELEVEWKNRPAFVAESISMITENARWTEQADGREGTLVGLVSVYYAPDPAALAGQKIELSGVNLQQRMGEALWIGQTHADQLLVVPAEGAKLPDAQAGDRLNVKGTLRKMPATSEAIERWNLDRKIAGEIGEEVVYIEAQSVSPSRAGATAERGGSDGTKDTTVQ